MDDVPEKKISPDHRILPNRHFLKFNFQDIIISYGSLSLFFLLQMKQRKKKEKKKQRDRDPR